MLRDRPLIVLGAAAVTGLFCLGACTSSGSVTPSGSVPATVSSQAGPSVPASVSTSPSQPLPSSRAPASGHSSPVTSSLPTTDPSPLTTVPTAAVRTLSQVPLTSPAPFGTGVTARVTAVSHGIDHDKGPGAATGRPTVLFHLILVNGSAKPVSVADVQVLAAYGSSATPAIADTGSTRMFSGTVRPGRSADAVYAFAVPASGQGDVALTVTYTAGQPTVLLTGSAR